MSANQPYPHMFSPITIRGLTLKNRAVMPGMGTLFMSDRFVTDQLIDYHVARTESGCGLNMVEVSSVHVPSSPASFGSLAEDKYIPGYRKLTDAIHNAGGKAGVMLWQGGLVAGGFPGIQMIVPSDMPAADGTVVPGASKALLQELVECYAAAARRAVEAGMDCLELHAAHTYIIHEFLSGAINHRTDEYGGSPENRARFPLEVIRAIRANIPEDMPLFMRVDAHDDYLENGLTIEETINFCKMAGKAGVDVIDVSRGNTLGNGLKYEVPPIDLPYAFNVDNAAQIRKETGMLVMAVGRINGAQLAEGILKRGDADLVGLGRVQLTDPQFLRKAQQGQVDRITRCMGCNQGCFDAHMKPEMLHITCVRNPAVGKERAYALQKTDSPKTVLVAGGGIAGMEAACTLSDRGHRTILCESTDTLGGQFLLAGQAPRKLEMKAAAKHKAIMTTRSKVDVRLNTEVTPLLLDEVRPDVVINATGAHAVRPALEGVALPHVLDVRRLLQGEQAASGNVVVIGGNTVGLEAAEYLAEKGCSVTVVEATGEVGVDLGVPRRICVMEHIAEKDIQLLTNTRCTEITDTGIRAEHDGESREIQANFVVLAVGAQSNSFAETEAWCKQAGTPLYTIGDAKQPRSALEAIAEGAQIAREI